MDDSNRHQTPPWVKIGGGLAIVLIVAFAVLHLAGGGFRHRHFPNGGPAQTEP
jgi:hypothetical protein